MEYVALKDLCDIKSGSTPSRKKLEYYGGSIPWAKISDLESSSDGYIYDTEEKITEEGLKSIRNRIFKPGTLFLAIYGSVGKTAISKIPISTNQAILGINIKDEKLLDVNYFQLWLKTIKDRLLNRAVGGTLKNISLGIVNELKIPLPPLAEQQRIAQILDQAAELRDKTKQLLTEYDTLAQSIFLDMFGDPVTNSMGWDVKKMNELSIKIGSGNTPKGGSNVYVKDGVKFFRSQNVWKNRLETDEIAFIDEATHNKMSRSSLKQGDILMTKTGRINTENSSLGRAAMYLGEDDRANLNGHVYLIRLKHEIVNKNFVLFILTSIQYRDYIRRICVGGIDKRQLNKDHLENFPIIYPSAELQNKFSEKIGLIDKQKELAQQELQEAENLFNGLLQKAFKGEL